MKRNVIAILSLATLFAAPMFAQAEQTGGSSTKKMMAEKNIVETAMAAEGFTTLVAAVKAAGLVDALTGEGPLTVLAPTDAAFAKLPKGTVEDLLKPENKAKLVAVLTYHVIKGKVPAATVVTLDSAPTLQGSNVEIKTEAGGVMVNNAKVVKTDIMCSNGVIHVIDTVLLPKM